MKKNKIELTSRNYATWIGNLGVVPLLRSFFLRFAPAFFTLLARLIRVSVVRDAIVQLLIPIKILYLKLFLQKPTKVSLLQTSLTVVKGVMLISYISYCYGSTSQLELQVGHHATISLKGVSDYSVGDKEIVATRPLPKTEELLLKGKSPGECEIVLWEKEQTKKWHIHVVGPEKKSESLSNSELSTSKEPSPKPSTKLNPSEVLATVYHALWQEYLQEVSCKWEDNQLLCQYAANTPPSPVLRLYLQKRFPQLLLYAVSHRHDQKNIKIQMKLLQMEEGSGREFSFGLQELSGTLGELFQRGLTAMLEKNIFLLRQNKISISTLAEPELMVSLGKKVTLEMGAEIPMEKQGAEHQTLLDWKFAGLKLTLQVDKWGDHFMVHYSTEFTYPHQKTVAGSKETSTLQLRPHEATTIFQLGLRTNGENETSFPLLSSIPIIGAIFTSKTQQTTYKKIYAIIQMGPQ